MLEQFQHAAELFPVTAFHAEDQIDVRGGMHELERVWILFKGLLDLDHRLGISPATILLDPFLDGGKTVVLRLVAQQDVHGSIEEVRHFHDQPQLRDRHARLPLVDGARRDAQHLGKLLLGQAALLSQGADVFGKLQFHIAFSFFLVSEAIIPEENKNVKIQVILTGKIFLYC